MKYDWVLLVTAAILARSSDTLSAQTAGSTSSCSESTDPRNDNRRSTAHYCHYQPVAAEIACGALPYQPIGTSYRCRRMPYQLTGGCYGERCLYAEGRCILAKNRCRCVRLPRFRRLLRRVLRPYDGID